MFHDHSKHIDIWYHVLRYQVHKGIVNLDYVPIDLQVVDILTTPLEKNEVQDI